MVGAEKLAFLESFGFARASHLEVTTRTTAGLLYIGSHVGFRFGLDRRDQMIDAVVIRVEDGRITPRLQGGFSMNLYGYAKRYYDYRGGFGEFGAEETLENTLEAWADFIKNVCGELLKDRADSLPDGPGIL